MMKVLTNLLAFGLLTSLIEPGPPKAVELVLMFGGARHGGPRVVVVGHCHVAISATAAITTGSPGVSQF